MKNDDSVGYALVTPGSKMGDFVRIQQIAVRADARRLHYGSMLIRCIKDFCQAHGRVGAQLRCRIDLESNDFWRGLGFSLYGCVKKGSLNHVGFSASNDINLWRIKLNDGMLTMPFMFDEISTVY
jgi:GNAT superfamily N-acetyltransferase